MSGRFLLDPNIVIALFADEAIAKQNLAQASEVFIPSFVIGERCYAARVTEPENQGELKQI